MNLKEALWLLNQMGPEPTREQIEEALGVLAEHTRETMWRPANTAPMHKRVLVASDHGEVVTATRVTGGWNIDGAVYAEPIMGLFLITHWMPLPEPPEVSK